MCVSRGLGTIIHYPIQKKWRKNLSTFNLSVIERHFAYVTVTRVLFYNILFKNKLHNRKSDLNTIINFLVALGMTGDLR